MSHDPDRHRLDDLRHFASSLGISAELSPTQAMALAKFLVWYDATGWSRFGIGSMPDWLHRLENQEINPKAEALVKTEHTATAVIDGRNGVGPLILARAAEIASEKAREVGVGLVRVHGLGAVGSAAAIVAEVAIGPMAALALGPRLSRAVAIPSANGLPAVFDSALSESANGLGDGSPSSLDGLLVSGSDWLIQVVSVGAIEPLASLQERVISAFEKGPFSSLSSPSLLHPVAWEEHRRQARERGVVLKPEAVESLRQWASKLGVDLPESLRGSS